MPDVLSGLNATEVNDRISRGLTNRVRSSALAEYGAIVRRNLLTVFNLLVIPPAVALFMVGEVRGGVAVSGMALTTSVLGLVQEIRARLLLRKLALLQVRQVRVLRDGQVQAILPTEIVLDDVLPLEAGETVVADGLVLQSDFLELDESLLTGESDPRPRNAGDTLLSGSVCSSGNGYYRATSVGAGAFVQQIAKQATAYRHPSMPFQRGLNRLLDLLTLVALGLCLLYLALYVPFGFRQSELFLMIAATITSMVPQGLILMASLAFTLAAVRLSQKGAVVQELSAVESMAAASVLCLDKTGTLTTGRLELARLVPLDPSFAEAEVRQRLGVFAHHAVDQGNRTIVALRSALASTAAEATVVSQVPFHSQRRFSAMQLRQEGDDIVLVLGAPEALERALADEAQTWLVDHLQGELKEGMRVLLFAQADAPADGFELTSDDPWSRLRLVPMTLVVLREELRTDAAATIRHLSGQGIRVKVLSGDATATIARVCESCGVTGDPPISGADLEQSEQRAQVIERATIFGRLLPQQKVEIITTHQARGDHVAMLGDGINDVLAIKKADLGLAMGSGSDAAQAVAGIVLRNDHFDLLPAVLSEGRRVMASLLLAARLFFLKNVYMLLLFLGTLLVLRLPFPILPQQVTLLNALTIAVPTLIILGTRPQVAGADHRRSVHAAIVFVLTRGICIGIGGLVLLAISAYGRGDSTATQRTLLVSTLVVHGLLVVAQMGYSVRADAIRQRRLLLGWPVIGLGLFVVLLTWHSSAYFFELTMPDVCQGVQVCVTAVGSVMLATLVERFLRWRV